MDEGSTIVNRYIHHVEAVYELVAGAGREFRIAPKIVSFSSLCCRDVRLVKISNLAIQEYGNNNS